MDKELKIAITIFLIFFVFGIASYLNQGSFASPVFMNQFVFLGTAILFLVINLKVKDVIVLWLYLSSCVMSFLIDHFTMGYLAEKMQNNWLLDLTQSTTFSVLFLVIYFGVFIIISFYFLRIHKKVLAFIVQLILLLITVIFMLFTQNSIDQDVCFHLFLILSILLINRLNINASKGFAVLSYQFLLLFLLESLEYFL